MIRSREFRSATLRGMRRVLAIRHGETDWNRESRWQGWVDRPLLPEALAQARARGRWLAAEGVRPAVLWSSDLQRALDTAEILGEVLGLPVTADVGLRERCGGDLEGLDRAGIEERFPGFLEEWRRGEVLAPPGGESDDEVYDRVLRSIDRIHNETPEEATIVAVTHGGVLRILAQRGGAEPKGTPNLGGRWFEYHGHTLASGPLIDGLPEPIDRAVHQVE